MNFDLDELNLTFLVSNWMDTEHSVSNRYLLKNDPWKAVHTLMPGSYKCYLSFRERVLERDIEIKRLS